MAFYNDAPGRKPQKKNYAAGSWADEGSQYSGARRFGPKRDDDRPYGRQEDRSYGERKPYGKQEDRSYGERKPYGKREDRPYGERKPYGKRENRPYSPGQRDDHGSRFDRKDDHRDFRRDDRKNFRREERRDFKPAEPKPAPSYRDAEYRPAAPAPAALEVPETTVNENLLAGRNPIREALRAGRDIEKLLVLKGELSGSAREIVQMAREAHIVVQEVEKARLDELAHNHQGLIAFASAYQYSTVEAMLEEAASRNEEPFLILLDGVTDPHNLGAIIRSAECVGAHGVIVPERRSVGLTPAAVKASAGAVEHMKVARVTNLSRTIEELKAHNIWAYAMDMDGEDYERVNFKGGVALVVGSEGEGVSRLVADRCDQKVSLPMAGHIDSLNASVAAGVMMYRVLSSRRA